MRYPKWLRRRQQLDMRTFQPLPVDGYLVGGALRDLLLGRDFDDLDWLVAEPEREARAAATALGGSAFALDEKRGHWRVVTSQGTRDYIRLDQPLEQELSSRDFTLNALAATLAGEIIDPCGGRQDLKRNIVRMVSEEGLERDPLRLLRGVRFVTTLGFRLDEATGKAITSCAAAQRAGSLPPPAWERIREELNRIISVSRAGRGFQLLDELDLLEQYLPELCAGRGVEQGDFHHLDVLGHSLEALNQLAQGFPEASIPLRWATLLHDVGKPPKKQLGEDGHLHFYGHDRLGAILTRQILRRLRQKRAVADPAGRLVRYHMLPLPRGEREARRFVHRRRDLLPDLLKLMIADREAARGPRSSEQARHAYRLALAHVIRLLKQSPPRKPLLDGREIMELLGLPEGPAIGEALRFIREAEAVGDIGNEEQAREVLLHFARARGWLSCQGR